MNADKHLADTFAENERMFPDIMEPWSIMLTDRDLSATERVDIMRRGLRETIRKRYLLAEAHEAPGSARPERQGALL